VLDEIFSSDADGLIRDFYQVYLAVDTFNTSPDSINFYDYSIISAYGVDQFGDFSSVNLYISSIAVGSYTGDDVGYYYSYSANATQGPSFSLNCNLPCNTITINITTNEGPGGFLEGDYSGTSDGYDNMQNPTVDKPVSGTFRVRIPN
jgi:hypothetical protein